MVAENQNIPLTEYLTVPQVARLLGLTRQRISQMAWSGQLESLHVGGRHLFRPDYIEWVRQQREARKAK